MSKKISQTPRCAISVHPGAGAKRKISAEVWYLDDIDKKDDPVCLSLLSADLNTVEEALVWLRYNFKLLTGMSFNLKHLSVEIDKAENGYGKRTTSSLYEIKTLFSELYFKPKDNKRKLELRNT